MDAKKKKRLNKYAIIVVLMIAIPEIGGHFYFETQKHPTSSSVDAAESLTGKQHNMYVNNTTQCQMVLKNDTSGTNVSRVAGLHGQYAEYVCK